VTILLRSQDFAAGGKIELAYHRIRQPTVGNGQWMVMEGDNEGWRC
jgi:hypothetical protein